MFSCMATKHCCGSKPMVPFWGRCTTQFSLFWWGLGCSLGARDFDPWPHSSDCLSCLLCGGVTSEATLTSVPGAGDGALPLHRFLAEIESSTLWVANVGRKGCHSMGVRCLRGPQKLCVACWLPCKTNRSLKKDAGTSPCLGTWCLFSMSNSHVCLV